MKKLVLVWALAVAMFGCGEKEHTDAELLKMARSTSNWDREVAVYQMIERYKPEFGEALEQALLDPDASVRRAALRNIGKTQDRRFLVALKMVSGSGIDSEDRTLAVQQYKLIEKAQEPAK